MENLALLVNESHCEPARPFHRSRKRTGGNLHLVNRHPSFEFCPELIPESVDEAGVNRKWGVIQDVFPVLTTNIEIANLQFACFLKGVETSIGGETLRWRAKELGGDLGLADAKHLLNHQDEIPEEWRGYFIVFPGTVLSEPGGRRLVPIMFWLGDRWHLYFLWLFNEWVGRDRLIVCEI